MVRRHDDTSEWAWTSTRRLDRLAADRRGRDRGGRIGRAATAAVPGQVHARRPRSNAVRRTGADVERRDVQHRRDDREPVLISRAAGGRPDADGVPQPCLGAARTVDPRRAGCELARLRSTGAAARVRIVSQRLAPDKLAGDHRRRVGRHRQPAAVHRARHDDRGYLGSDRRERRAGPRTDLPEPGRLARCADGRLAASAMAQRRGGAGPQQSARARSRHAERDPDGGTDPDLDDARDVDREREPGRPTIGRDQRAGRGRGHRAEVRPRPDPPDAVRDPLRLPAARVHPRSATLSAARPSRFRSRRSSTSTPPRARSRSRCHR